MTSARSRPSDTSSPRDDPHHGVPDLLPGVEPLKVAAPAYEVVGLHEVQRGGDVLPVVGAVALGVGHRREVALAEPVPGAAVIVPSAGVQEGRELLGVVEAGMQPVTLDPVDLADDGGPVPGGRVREELVGDHRPVPWIEVAPGAPLPIGAGLGDAVAPKQGLAGLAGIGEALHRRLPVLQVRDDPAALPPEIADPLGDRDVALDDSVLQDQAVPADELGAAVVLEIPQGADDREICQIAVPGIYLLRQEVGHAGPADLVRAGPAVEVGVKLIGPAEAVEHGLPALPPFRVGDVMVGDDDAVPDEAGHVGAAQVAYPDEVPAAGVYHLHGVLRDLLLVIDGEILAQALQGGRCDRAGGYPVGIDVRDHQDRTGAPDGAGGFPEL